MEVRDFLSLKRSGMPLVDVRSPKEYSHARIPDAVSIPLFDDSERAEVGTLYTHSGKVPAVQRGLELVGPKLKGFTDRALALGSEEILVHCWRGGMRSSSLAWLFGTVGLKCHVLTGGYKAYRNYVLDTFTREYDLCVVGGCTGSGKTDLLKELRIRGGQVLDLEQLANHKGSAFGSLGEDPQPSVEMFENMLSEVLDAFDPAFPVFVEDESRNVGKVVVPQGLWEQMKKARMIIVQTDRDIRMDRIMRDYACYPPEEIAGSILKIEKRMGRERCREAYGLCLGGDVRAAAELCLEYYDRLYLSQLEKRRMECAGYDTMHAGTMDMGEMADRLMEQFR